MNIGLEKIVKTELIDTKINGHFGEFIQGFYKGEGENSLGLITLPCDIFSIQLNWQPEMHTPFIGDNQWARKALTYFCKAASIEAWGGQFALTSNMPDHLGLGSSTAIALAAFRLVHKALGKEPSADEEAKHVLDFERAMDPLHLAKPESIIWAPREGRILAALPELPPMHFLGIIDGPGQQTKASDLDFPDMTEAFYAFINGCKAGDLKMIGAACTHSARANQSRNAKPHWDAVQNIADASGSVGICVAHTGAAMALIHETGNLQGISNAKEQLNALGFEVYSFSR